MILTLLYVNIHNKFKNLFFSQSLRWCNSYEPMETTMWIWLIILCYVIFLTIFTIARKLHYKNGIVENLCKCVEKGDIVKCVELLEKYSRYINVYNHKGYTPFLVACANGNTQIIKLMLKKGANVKLKSKHSESAFYLATFYFIKNPHLKNATCIRELYYAGANINEPNAKGLNALQMAAMFGHTPLVKWLLLKNATVCNGPDPYILANSQGHQDTANVIFGYYHRLAIEFK